jgi:TonB family protein
MALFFLCGSALSQTPSKYQISHASGPCRLVLRNKELVSPKIFQSPDGKIYLKGPLTKFSIAPEGNVSDVTVIRSSGSKRLDKAVVASLAKWRYKPRPAQCGTIDSQILISPDLLSSDK